MLRALNVTMYWTHGVVDIEFIRIAGLDESN
jgi:hypothetical protein